MTACGSVVSLADRVRARGVLARLPPQAHVPRNHAAVITWLRVLCELAGALTPALERRVRPWRALEARVRAEFLADLRTSRVAPRKRSPWSTRR
jgi:hypothetical protein